ncbi:F-box protein At5g07610-like [Solanum dulcamara]|uniref:F-box protein At5g07610-like n=1 Tax=Solanum dulcamara TaxID=45834 RepID=UPI002484DCCF|nr:F-box protein At5g07610-like [Solanum dulcamara]
MSSSKHKLFIYEEIIINVLNRLPLKSLARFKCVSKKWRKYIAEVYRCRLQWPKPYLIGFFCVEKRLQSRFFFSSKESPLLIGTSLDESVDSIGERVYVVASSNGFLLCNKLRSWQRVYYVYNPATRQRLDLPKTLILMDDPYVGFTYKVDEDDSVSFTIVRFVVPVSWEKFGLQYSLTIESFSSEINIWTANKLIVDVPIDLYPSRDMTSSTSAGVVDGVFCWLDSNGRWMTVYDSIRMCFWALELPEHTVVYPGYCCLGLSGGELCFASNRWTTTITCWRLSNFPSRDAVWVWKYDVDVATVVQKCQEDFGLGGNNALGFDVGNMIFHPALSDILYLQIRGKVISYDLNTSAVELVYDFGQPWRKTLHYKLFSYEWPQWPRLQ